MQHRDEAFFIISGRVPPYPDDAPRKPCTDCDWAAPIGTPIQPLPNGSVLHSILNDDEPKAPRKVKNNGNPKAKRPKKPWER